MEVFNEILQNLLPQQNKNVLIKIREFIQISKESKEKFVDEEDL
jgi:hypothetical protein